MAMRAGSSPGMRLGGEDRDLRALELASGSAPASPRAGAARSPRARTARRRRPTASISLRQRRRRSRRVSRSVIRVIRSSGRSRRQVWIALRAPGREARARRSAAVKHRFPPSRLRRRAGHAGAEPVVRSPRQMWSTTALMSLVLCQTASWRSAPVPSAQDLLDVGELLAAAQLVDHVVDELQQLVDQVATVSTSSCLPKSISLPEMP